MDAQMKIGNNATRTLGVESDDRTRHPGFTEEDIDSFMRTLGIKGEGAAKDSSKGVVLEGDHVDSSPGCKRPTGKNQQLMIEIQRRNYSDVVKALPRTGYAWTFLSEIPPRIEGGSDWSPGSSSSSDAFEVKVILRQAFSNFRNSDIGPVIDMGLTQWGIWYVCNERSRKFRTVDEETRSLFSSFNHGGGFSGMVRDVMTADCSAGIKKRLLELLLETAKTFIPQKRHLLASRPKRLTWSSSLGEQYFVLCKNIVEWNRKTFHPDLRSKENMEKMKRLGERGAFTVEGINVDNLVTGLLLS